MKFNKKSLILLTSLLLIFSLAGCAKKDAPVEENEVVQENTTNETSEKTDLTIAAAASLTDVMEDIKVLYEKDNTDTNLLFTFNGSGALQAQIEEGAPIDVFISAAEKQMNALEESENIMVDTRKTLLENKVVLIKPVDSDLGITTFEELNLDEVSKLAIGDPASVPVGQYSEEIFENLGLTESIQDKLVLASDVRTVLTWVENKETDLGIVYATDAFTTDQVEIITEAPEGSHKPVTYPVAVVTDTANEEMAKNFVDFLSTDEVKEIFESYGFVMK